MAERSFLIVKTVREWRSVYRFLHPMSVHS
jgi:hypothetical protein